MRNLLIGIFLILFTIPVLADGDQPIDALQRRLLEQSGSLRAVDYEVLLKVKHGWCVSDLELSEGHPWAGLALKDSRPSDMGIVVFLLVDSGVLIKQPTDTPEDFEDLFSFEEAFETSYPWGG